MPSSKSALQISIGSRDVGRQLGLASRPSGPNSELGFRRPMKVGRADKIMWQTWFLAARPKTLFAGICPVVLGTALAEREGLANPVAALAALLGALSIQIGTNFCNDYFDFRQGADTGDRKGPTRAVAAGLVSPAMMLAATLAAFSITAAVCLYLVARAGWPLAVLGAISILCGVWYTATRFSLAYLGLGDLFVLVFFGPVAVAGTFYVQALRFSLRRRRSGYRPRADFGRHPRGQ